MVGPEKRSIRSPQPYSNVSSITSRLARIDRHLPDPGAPLRGARYLSEVQAATIQRVKLHYRKCWRFAKRHERLARARAWERITAVGGDVSQAGNLPTVHQQI
ncbi:hypothetical protein D9M71_173260 [compost metagenome]